MPLSSKPKSAEELSREIASAISKRLESFSKDDAEIARLEKKYPKKEEQVLALAELITPSILTALSPLIQERDELLKDKERLDWLDKHGNLAHLYKEGRPNTTLPTVTVKDFQFDFDDMKLREAIDKGIAGTKD